MMKRTVLLWIAGAVVLAGSTTAAVLAAQDGDTTTSAVCVPVDDTDRDKAGLADHVAVVMVDHRVKEQPNETNVEVFSQIRVEETLKGASRHRPPSTRSSSAPREEASRPRALTGSR